MSKPFCGTTFEDHASKACFNGLLCSENNIFIIFEQKM